ncbi:hypothetical protein [Arcticibacter sp. MXS-1]|uniref:hypothetical protein n=1 Tax=Arcticibacter sp. MXS-1 TaxID=3341726 RepID=UPI0035A87E5E
MELNNRNGDWQEEAPVLASMRKESPFTVPDNYFNELSENIRSRAGLEQLKSNDAGLKVPDGYFESLEEQILSAVKLDSIKEESGTMPFTVPPLYFEKLEAKIRSKTSESKTHTVIRRLRPAWFQYAAAACAVLVIGIPLFLNITRESVDSKFASLPEEDIVYYLQVHSDSGDVPLIMENMDRNTTAADYNPDLTDQEIKQYLDSTTL